MRRQTYGMMNEWEMIVKNPIWMPVAHAETVECKLERPARLVDSLGRVVYNGLPDRLFVPRCFMSSRKTQLY